MQRKTMMGMAAVAAVVGLLYLRSRNAAAATAGTGAVVSSGAGAGAGTSWASILAGLLGGGAVSKTNPTKVADTTVKSPAPTGGATFGGTTPGSSTPFPTPTVSDSGLMTYPDGSSHQMTPDELYAYRLQQGGKTLTGF